MSFPLDLGFAVFFGVFFFLVVSLDPEGSFSRIPPRGASEIRSDLFTLTAARSFPPGC